MEDYLCFTVVSHKLVKGDNPDKVPYEVQEGISPEVFVKSPNFFFDKSFEKKAVEMKVLKTVRIEPGFDDMFGWVNRVFDPSDNKNPKNDMVLVSIPKRNGCGEKLIFMSGEKERDLSGDGSITLGYDGKNLIVKKKI